MNPLPSPIQLFIYGNPSPLPSRDVACYAHKKLRGVELLALILQSGGSRVNKFSTNFGMDGQRHLRIEHSEIMTVC